MMPFPLPRLSVFILSRGGRGAVCAAFFLCFSAAAQTIPQGYVATREGDVIVMRPSQTADPDIAIRIYPPVGDDHDPADVLHRWAESHPPAGVDPRALRLQDKIAIGVSSLSRSWTDGTQAHVELIMMPQAGPGHYRPLVARMPPQPAQPLNNQSQAVGQVVALILAGKFQPNIPADGKGNPVVTTAPVEPEGKRSARERPAPGRPGGTGTQAAMEQLGRLAAQIETVGFMNRGQMGVGGMWIFVPKPVVLFRSGDTLFDMGNLSRVTSVDADRAAHPKDWGRWRRTAGGIEILQGDKWKKLDYPRTIERLPAGFVLSGKYEYLSGGGNQSIGGGELVVSQRSYAFRPDGKYSGSRLGFVSSHEEFGSTVARSQSPVLEGRYSVDGYLLRLEPPAGPPETHVFVFDPKDPNTVWIDGHGYTRAK
jgi:hypothetical protein